MTTYSFLVLAALVTLGVGCYKGCKDERPSANVQVEAPSEVKSARGRLRDFYISSIENQSKTNRPYATPSPLLQLL